MRSKQRAYGVTKCCQPSIFFRIFTEKCIFVCSLEISAICTGKKWESPAKRKPAKFLSSWTLPPGFTVSSKGPSFAYCKFCKDNFSVTHGGCLPCIFVSYAYEMYRNFIPCACNLCIHPCFVGFGDVIFYDYLQKMCSFLGEK